MGNERPQFDQADATGNTQPVATGFTTTVTKIPAAPIANQFISEVLVNTQQETNGSIRLEVSFDEGATYMSFKKNTIVGWFVRGQVQQLWVKSSSGTHNGEVVVNMEEC